MRVCEEGGYEWVEDPTNSGDVYHRSRVRKVISQNPHIKPGVIGLIDTCGLVKDKIRDIGKYKSRSYDNSHDTKIQSRILKIVETIFITSPA